MKITQSSLVCESVNGRFGSVGRFTSYAWSRPMETCARLALFALTLFIIDFILHLIKFFMWLVLNFSIQVLLCLILCDFYPEPEEASSSVHKKLRIIQTKAWYLSREKGRGTGLNCTPLALGDLLVIQKQKKEEIEGKRKKMASTLSVFCYSFSFLPLNIM